MDSIGDRYAVRSMRRLFVCGLALLTAVCVGRTVLPARAQISDAHGARCSDAYSPVVAGPGELRQPAAPCYDVVALRVEFRPDTTRFTTGDGTFGGDLFGGLEPSVDPLPHDAAYFQAHLDFLEHYVARVSDGRTVVRTHLIPEVVRLPNRMGSYAPTGPNADSDEERSKLARLVYDAWTSADAELSYDMSGFAPERTALVIFHAGVGRDIELMGLTLDKTPEDLPSIYFGEETLNRLGAAGATFNVFPVNHSMIVPRTETRKGTDFIANEPYLLELSINGMLAASFFNFLGAPDLFDVESGESAIGPFGLMDGQGIFAYGGLFPPEPMAWTKYYLGWTDPLDLDGPGPHTVNLQAMSLPDAAESARALVSDAEYFLVENRYRDPEGDGLTLRVWKDGAIEEQHVENGDESFNSTVISGFIGGVVVGVDNYDWALPGGLDVNDNELNGGLLIWHVDERRLREGLSENAVNVAGRRAIDLEEADGAQDIGFPSQNPFAPRADRGTPFDFFYRGNPVFVETTGGREIRLYRNRFGPDTFPGSETNAGGPSFIVLDEFSDPGAEMSFVYRLEAASGIERVASDTLLELQTSIRAAGAPAGTKSSILVGDGATVVYSHQTSSVFVGGSSTASYASLTHPVVDDALVRIHPVDADGRSITSLDLSTGALRWSVRLPESVDGMQPVSPLVQLDAEGRSRYWVIMEGGGRRTLVSAAPDRARMEPTGSLGTPLALAVIDGDELVVVGDAGAGYPGLDPFWTYSITETVGQPVFGTDAGGTFGALPLLESGRLRILHADGRVRDIDAVASAARAAGVSNVQLSAFPTLADLDGDDRLDVVVAVGNHLFAFTQSGAVVAGYPVHVGAAVTAQILVVRRSGGAGSAVLVPGDDGYLYGFTDDGRRLEGFPLEVGRSVRATPSVDGLRLLAVSDGGTVKAWRWPESTGEGWVRLFGEQGNTSYAPGTVMEEVGLQGPLIDSSETYNWPNPIEDGVTHLRIRTERDARVEITIVDAAGSMVQQVDMGTVDGGVPVEAVWQAGDVQSGLYFARFTATTSDGRRETRLVKMAVIR